MSMYQIAVLVAEFYSLFLRWMRGRDSRPIIIFLSIFSSLFAILLSFSKLDEESKHIINILLAIVGLPLLIVWYISLVELQSILRKWLGGRNG